MLHQLLLTVFLVQSPSFIEQSIASAREEIAREPGRTEGYNDLALALVRKSRQTADRSFLSQAEVAVAKSLQLETANFGARRARVAIRLAQARYQDALEEAEALRKQRPDENPLYSYISEAQIALGNYADAEKAVQRMLDLRSVNGPGFESGAILRELIGYPEAALEWWQSALHLVSDRDTEERAYIYSQMARVYRETGKYDPGVQCTQQAFQLEPDYPAALFELARIRIEQRKNAEAVALLRSRLAKGPDLPSLYWLAFAQEQQGDSTAWAAFEKSARAVQGAPGNADTLLIRYLAAHGHAGDALTLARNALKSHHDLFTLQADAVALEKAGQPLEALQQIRKALEPGLLDASLYVDAGRIAAEANDRKAAAAYFRKAFELGSNGFYSAEILKMLSSMSDTDSN